MVGEDHQHVALAQLLHDLADEGVVVEVELLDRVLVRARLVPARGRVALLGVAPEHVLDAVGGVEDAGDGPAPLPLEGRQEHLLALAVDVVRHLQEGAVVDDPLVERPGVLGQPERREGPDPLGEVGRVVGRVGDGHGRVLGVEVERRHVERDVLAQLREHHPADGLHLDPGRRAEGERDPVAQASRARARPRRPGSSRAPAFRPGSGRISSGRVIGGLPARKVFSGPSIRPV